MRVLVATDGSTGSDGAVRAAVALESVDHASISLLSVIDPPLVEEFGHRFGLVKSPPPVTLCETTRRQRAVSRQLERVGGRPWPASIVVGERGPTIARAAAETGASLIVMGAETPPLLEGVRPGQTLGELVGLARTPLLIVPATAGGRPRSALVAVDFSEQSVAAARVAAELLETGGTLHLVHVAVAPHWSDALEDEPRRPLGPGARLAALGREIHAAVEGRLSIEVRVARGDPALELLATADRLEVQLVALGTRGEGFAGAPLAGSVSAPIVHGASCSVLVYPPQASPELRWDCAGEGARSGRTQAA